MGLVQERPNEILRLGLFRCIMHEVMEAHNLTFIEELTNTTNNPTKLD